MHKKELTRLWKSVRLYGVVNKSSGNPEMNVETTKSFLESLVTWKLGRRVRGLSGVGFFVPAGTEHQ